MRYGVSGRTFFGLWFGLIPLALLLLLSVIFGCAAAVDAVPDARARAAVDFLAANGWEADAATCETACAPIPEVFGKVWTDYNALQLSQGFDLSPCRGRVLTRYTFSVANPPDGADGPVLANIFFDGDVIAAADLCAVGLNGFIRGVVGGGAAS